MTTRRGRRRSSGTPPRTWSRVMYVPPQLAALVPDAARVLVSSTVYLVRRDQHYDAAVSLKMHRLSLMLLYILPFTNNFFCSSMWSWAFRCDRRRDWPRCHTRRSQRRSTGWVPSPRGSLSRSTTAATRLYHYFHGTPSRPPAPPRLVVPTRHRRPRHAHPTRQLSTCRALRRILPWGCLRQGAPLIGLAPTRAPALGGPGPAPRGPVPTPTLVLGAATTARAAAPIPSSYLGAALPSGINHYSMSNNIQILDCIN
jgi:hypothetical protein